MRGGLGLLRAHSALAQPVRLELEVRTDLIPEVVRWAAAAKHELTLLRFRARARGRLRRPSSASAWSDARAAGGRRASAGRSEPCGCFWTSPTLPGSSPCLRDVAERGRAHR